MIHDKQFSRSGGARSLYRACVLEALRAGRPGVTERWPEDHVVPLLLRAASDPVTLAGTPELAQVIEEFVDQLVPFSAAAALFAMSTPLTFGAHAQITIPRLADLPEPQWVAEGQPIRVVQGRSSSVSMTPYKLATIVPLSNDIMLAGPAEAVVRQALLNKIGPALDRALFSDVAGTPGLRPPGLINGVASSNAAGAGGPTERMLEDMATLVSALEQYGGGAAQIVFITGPSHAVRMMMRPRSAFPVLTVAGLNTLIAIVASALAVAIDPPGIRAGDAALLHMEDANPLEIVDSAGVAAAPVRSTWQEDSVGLRFILPVSWALHTPAVAWLTPNWIVTP